MKVDGKWTLVKSEVVRDENVNPFIKNTYTMSLFAKSTSITCEPSIVLVQSIDDEPPALYSEMEVMTVDHEPKPKTMLDRFFCDAEAAAKTLSNAKELTAAMREYGTTMSMDDRGKLECFFAQKWEND